ncbi:MAG: ABC transporter ATP-binding protein [Candidatus Pacebacteria bacterium]|nr:ABC transporter ATP-binding protein [Candidatus Paceibacterota bacterium]MDD5555382.1 ABC transporter ATP-binding protein [Candidatus Paceibacterota bacterium]
MKNKKFTFWRFWEKLKEIYRPFFGVIAVIFLLMLLQEALALISPYIYGKIVDGILQGRAIMEVIKLCFLSLAILLFNEIVVNSVRERIEIQKFEFDVPRKVAEKTLSRVFEFSIGQHENQNSGIKKSIIDRGQNALVELANILIYQLVPTFLQLGVTVAALFVLAPPLGAVILIGTLAFLVVSFYTNYALRDELKKVRDMWVDSDKKQSEFLRNVSLIKMNAKEKEVVGEHDRNLTSISFSEKGLWMKFMKYTQIRNFVSSVSRVAALILGIYLVYQGAYTPGFLVIVLSWSNNAFDRIWYLSAAQRRITKLFPELKNYFALMDISPDIKEIENPVVVDNFKGRIEYKNVSFRYPLRDVKEKKVKDQTGLKGISILIEPGQRVAIVGASGAGKSTVIQLLIRAYDPDKGKILIDGHDLRKLSLNNYRKAIGIVSQDIVLFDDTLRYNIVFGTSERVTEKQIREAIKMARVDGFLKGLEKGLDTIIGERGVKLSGGERQRVGIARALIKNPAILIFDEATSSLDVENESLIKESIEKASKGRTTIIIAHRLSTIKDADKIIVLEKGKIVGQGKHRELLKTCPAYQKMISIQTVIVGDIDEL